MEGAQARGLSSVVVWTPEGGLVCDWVHRPPCTPVRERGSSTHGLSRPREPTQAYVIGLW